jgi:methylenetetrahydrofolate reductase (NADPH)
MDGQQALLRQHLRTARFEVLPLRGAEEQASALPEGSVVTVTSSPNKGIETTLDLAGRLRARGLHAVPHLAARMVQDPAHLRRVLDRFEGHGLDEAFVVAGDASPAGAYPDALSLLRAVEDLGRRPSRVGITGYPEGHAFLSDSDLSAALEDKAPHADYAVTQICFDATTITSWIKQVRDRGVTLPVHIGAPGVVDVTKLLRISMKIGLGDSMRFLRKQHGVVGKLLARYTPEDLFEELAPALADPGFDIAGWHLFTFNEISKTDQWRHELATRLQEVPA